MRLGVKPWAAGALKTSRLGSGRARGYWEAGSLPSQGQQGKQPMRSRSEAAV